MSDAIPDKNWDASPVKFEANDGDARDASPIKFEAKGVDTIPVLKEEEQLLEPVNDEPADGILDSLPIDLEAKNGNASLLTEAMKKEEEQLEDTRLKAEEEEEARKREEAAKLAFDPKARYSKLDELLTKTQLYSEFLLEKMDKIADVCISHCVLTVFFLLCSIYLCFFADDHAVAWLLTRKSNLKVKSHQ